MGRFHRHDDGTVHTHDHSDPENHGHDHHEHGDHSGYETGSQRIDVLESIFAENDVRADYNRKAFESNGIRGLISRGIPRAWSIARCAGETPS